MCDQTEISYLEDDVVWVKIGPIWWPGVVKDLEKNEEGKEILAGLKKKPLAAVKFFQEDNYEFVKNLDCIYHYGCSRKDEFIKKGLDKFRTGAPHMKKFPVDVTTAESLTNGDVNIINDPKFLPEKKESYSEIFGSTKKKSKKDSELSPRSRGRPAVNVTPYRPITHQRFINKALHGESDHRVKTLIQTNPASDDSTSKNFYKCHICKFQTSRVNVIVAHHRLSHSSKNSINWTGSDSKLIKKRTSFKSRKVKAKKIFETSYDDFSDEEILEKKKSPKSKSSKEKIKSSEKVISPIKRKKKEELFDIYDSKKPRFTDVLLADWNEEEEDDKKEKPEDYKIEDEKNVDSKVDLPSEDVESKSENISASVDSAEQFDSQTSLKSQSGKMSCFDFDEEEEGFIGMSNANTYGRKIPRVIPVKDKSDLGIDLEIEELFKKKNESESEAGNENSCEEVEKDNIKNLSENVEEKQEKQEKQSAPITGKRRSKSNKEEDATIFIEDSLALRRSRRPGAKKSYLNEVIEKIDDEETKPSCNNKKQIENSEISPVTRVETSSSSRRKQDFKNQNIDSSREEMVYSEIIPEDQKTKSEQFEKKSRKSRKEVADDLTTKIDSLLEETKLPTVPGIPDAVQDKSENILKLEEIKPNTTSFSFDYTPNDVFGKKSGKKTGEVKSISRMFSDSIPSSEPATQEEQETLSQSEQEESKLDEALISDSSQNKSVQGVIVKLSQTAGNTTQKRGSIVLNTLPKISEGSVKVLPVVKQIGSSKDCVVVPAGRKIEVKEAEQLSEGETKNIKTIKVKSDSLPSSLITSGKLKGQTIIHQKGGKYVIVTQPPQSGRQRTTPGKVQAGNKVVIFTNQLGEQKIITTSGLQQAKFKVEGQKIIPAPEVASDKEIPSSSSQAPPQSVIKMVPDGKGGIMKQITMSPKKVILGGTKVLVSASGGNTLSSGSSIQKIALPSSGGSRAGGDFRLIENYKGSGKTVLIQGNPNPSSGVVLKSSSTIPRQVTKVIQNPQTIPSLKKKPKILMRASTRQGEYVMQPASSNIESPTYVVKQKGSDGKISAQKIIRTDTANQAKVLPAGTGTKRFFLSGQTASKNGESYIITTNEAVPSKIIRMRQKIKDVDTSVTKTQKMIQKAPEIYALAQNSVLIPSQSNVENEPTQIVQIQEQPQQSVLQTQVIAMPGPVRADGNQTYVLVSVDEHGVVQGMDNSIMAYDACAQQDQIFVNSTTAGNVILLNSQSNEEVTPVYSTSGQDILAEALANTNVLEGNLSNDMEVVPSILLPPSMPSSVVQETSITLQKPIMTPLEMPSSVTPDTSGLEPPPLPPTPTNEDVLMEESENSVAGGLSQEQLIRHDQKEQIDSEDAVQTYLQSGNFEVTNDDSQTTFQISTGLTKMEENQEICDNHFDKPKVSENENREQGDSDIYLSDIQENTGQNKNKIPPQEDFLIENSQEEQSINSYQSMPLLNDEPDTSDDAQNSEPIADQQFEAQKSRIESEQFSQIIKDQEPPSSTNNENPGSEFDDSSNYHPVYQTEGSENEQKTKESEEKNKEEIYEENKEELTVGKESQSMPIITDDNPGVYEMESVYSEVMSQKRIQEETEVSSTTDEYENKNVTN